MSPVPAPAGSAIRPRLAARVRRVCLAVLLAALSASASASASGARADIPPEGTRGEDRHASRTYRRVGLGGSLLVVLMVVIARRRRAASRAGEQPRAPGDPNKS